MGLSYAAIAASLKASESVGCAWHVLPMSSAEAPYSKAKTPSAIISPALECMMWMPRTLSVYAQLKIFTRPSVSMFVRAREFALNGNTPFL